MPAIRNWSSGPVDAPARAEESTELLAMRLVSRITATGQLRIAAHRSDRGQFLQARNARSLEGKRLELVESRPRAR